MTVFPTEPEQTQFPILGFVDASGYSFAASHGVTRCVVAISEYPQEYIEGSTEEQRSDTARDMALFGLGGKLVRETPIQLQGRTGREIVIAVEEIGVTRTRLFWVGQRMYQINVTYKEKFLNPQAAEYFLDSFQFDPD